MLALHIPEEDRCLDILELKERQELLTYVELVAILAAILAAIIVRRWSRHPKF